MQSTHVLLLQDEDGEKVDAVAKEKNDVAELGNFEEMVARRR